jgi:hypothetical protein
MNCRVWHALPAMLGLTFFAIAQQGTVSPPQSARFQWDFRKAKELDLKDSIKRNKVLTEEQKKALVSAVSMQYRPKKDDPDTVSPSEIHEIAMDTRIALVDLNSDGVSEVIAQPVGDAAGCGATGNCPIWIFEQSPTGYKVLLDGTAQTFTVQNNVTEGFDDLVLGQHASASEQVLYLYLFRNGRYRKSACYDANWQIVTDTEVKELKEPRITKCNWK